MGWGLGGLKKSYGSVSEHKTLSIGFCWRPGAAASANVFVLMCFRCGGRLGGVEWGLGGLKTHYRLFSERSILVIRFLWRPSAGASTHVYVFQCFRCGAGRVGGVGAWRAEEI